MTARREDGRADPRAHPAGRLRRLARRAVRPGHARRRRPCRWHESARPSCVTSGRRTSLALAVVDWQLPARGVGSAASSRATSSRRFGSSSTATRRWATPMCACSSSKGASPRSTTCSPSPATATADWIETTFAPVPARAAAAAVSSSILTLYAATDVTVWKLLRRDLGRSRAKTETIIRNLVEGATGTPDPMTRGSAMTNTPQRYLLPMWDGGGTVAPGLGVARRLIARGHAVHVLADPTIARPGRPRPAARSRRGPAPHRTSLDPDQDLLHDWETANPLVMLQPGPRPLHRRARRAVRRRHRRCHRRRSVPTSWRPTTCCSAQSSPPRPPDVPVVPIVPNIWTLPSPGVPAIGPGFPLAKGCPGRCRDAALRSDGQRPVPARAATPQRGPWPRAGSPPLRSFYDQVLDTRTDPRALQPERSTSRRRPSRQRQLYRSDPRRARMGRALERTAARSAGDPLVLVGFSSTYQEQGPLLQRVVDALSSLAVRGVVTLGQMLAGRRRASVADNVDGGPVGTARPDPRAMRRWPSPTAGTAPS